MTSTKTFSNGSAVPEAVVSDAAQVEKLCTPEENAQRNMDAVKRLLKVLLEKQVSLEEALEGKKIAYTRFSVLNRKLYDDIDIEIKPGAKGGQEMIFTLRSVCDDQASGNTLEYYQEFRELIPKLCTSSNNLILGKRTPYKVYPKRNQEDSITALYVEHGEHPIYTLSITSADSLQLLQKIEDLIATASTMQGRDCRCR